MGFVPASGDCEAEGRLEDDIEQRRRPPVHVAQQRTAEDVGRHARALPAHEEWLRAGLLVRTDTSEAP